jgi:hypothetical protein
MAMKRFLAAFTLFGCLGLVTGCDDSTPKTDNAAAKKSMEDSNAALMKKSSKPVRNEGAETSDDAAADKAGNDEKAKEE